MESPLLTDDELARLTRAQRPSGQAKVLRAHGIKFVTGLDGGIATTWAAVNAALAPPPGTPPRKGPNLAHLEREANQRRENHPN